ncbi:uncharacterized protein LOC115988659 [Quercus lobata]|uniref:uncharacterized protein LOC115988659 n=1 Tax=Quercus lobata TaxID=97700 RepID=UPI001244E716|nr:uncharacterized protein LOC115988659 [Quercus lobata]
MGLQHEQIGSASRFEELQISAVTQINEPDSLYGVNQSHKVMKESPATFSALTYAPRRSVSKSQEQPVIAGPPPPPPVSETPVSSKNANENSSNKDYEVQMPSVLLMAALPNFPIMNAA